MCPGSRVTQAKASQSYLRTVASSTLGLGGLLSVCLKIFRRAQRRLNVEPRASFCSDLHRFLDRRRWFQKQWNKCLDSAKG